MTLTLTNKNISTRYNVSSSYTSLFISFCTFSDISTTGDYGAIISSKLKNISIFASSFTNITAYRYAIGYFSGSNINALYKSVWISKCTSENNWGTFYSISSSNSANLNGIEAMSCTNCECGNSHTGPRLYYGVQNVTNLNSTLMKSNNCYSAFSFWDSTPKSFFKYLLTKNCSAEYRTMIFGGISSVASVRDISHLIVIDNKVISSNYEVVFLRNTNYIKNSIFLRNDADYLFYFASGSDNTFTECCFDVFTFKGDGKYATNSNKPANDINSFMRSSFHECFRTIERRRSFVFPLFIKMRKGLKS